MTSHNITRYFAETDSFVGSDDLTIREALRGLFWNRYRIRETNQKRAALAITQPTICSSTSSMLMTFIDANGIFRFRICVGCDVEEVDKTFPETVAHINVLVRVSHS
jgi:hypothetical protein